MTWGWKATMTIYVEGEMEDAERACDVAYEEMDAKGLISDLGGVFLEEQVEPPKAA